LHLAAGLAPLERAVEAALAGPLPERAPPPEGSRLHYHPTLWGYLKMRWRQNVR
jgi:hypothetical protein